MKLGLLEACPERVEDLAVFYGKAGFWLDFGEFGEFGGFRRFGAVLPQVGEGDADDFLMVAVRTRPAESYYVVVSQDDLGRRREYHPASAVERDMSEHHSLLIRTLSGGRGNLQ